MRRGFATIGLILLITLGWNAPVAAQAQSGWSVQIEANAGFFKSTRDVGKILGAEVQAQIKTVLQPAPLFGGGILLRGPSPNYSLRASAAYMAADARGQAVGCDSNTITGAGCSAYDISSTVITGFFDVLLHNDVTGTGILRYFVAGVGLRSYAFDESECRDAGTDPILIDVCTPMEEFLVDQTNPVGRIGVGLRGRGGPVGWHVEVTDMVGRVTGGGERGEGGTQNDFVVSVGLSFPSG